MLDPDWFCSHVLGVPNDPWQSEMMHAVADLDRIKLGLKTKFNHEGKNRFSVAAFHGPGKTHWLAKEILWCGFTRVSRIPCAGPKEKTIKTRLWPEIRKLLRSAQPWFKALVEVGSANLQWCGNPDHCAIIEAASQPENLAGYHDTHLMFLVDEASGVENVMFETIEGALTDENAILILIGNPTRTSGEFYDSHNKLTTKALYYSKQIRHEESNRPNLAKWAADMIAKYGRNSPVVKVRVFGEFVDMEVNQLYAMEWWEEARIADSKSDGSIPKVRVSIDVADGGVDETVFHVGLHYLSGVDIVLMARKSFPPATATVDAADFGEQLFLQYGGQKDGGVSGDDFVVDGIGVGAGTSATLAKRGYNVIKHKGGDSSDDPVRYRNRRSQVHLVARDFMRDGRVCFREDAVREEDWDDYLAQVASIKMKPGIERVEEIQPKAELLRKGVKSPDIEDSFTMQFATRSEYDAEIPEFSFAAPSGAGDTPWRLYG